MTTLRDPDLALEVLDTRNHAIDGHDGIVCVTAT